LTASGVLSGLAFAPTGWWWTLFVAPALWLGTLQSGEVRLNAWRSFWWGLVYGATVSWHTAPTFAQQAKTDGAGGIAWTIALIWLASWSALLGALAGYLPQSALWRALGLACLWTAVQWLRSLGVLGFPWAMMALGLAPVPFLLQPAALGGIWLTEWLLMAWNALLAQAWQGRWRQSLAVMATLSLFWFGFSTWAWHTERASMQPTMRVAVIQHKAEQDFEIVAPSIFDELVTKWLAQAQAQGAQWVVLPEVADPYTLNMQGAQQTADPRLQRWRDWAKTHGLHVLIGARRDDGADRNSALLIARTGELCAYDKVKLMAFVEWSPPAPFSQWLRVLGVGYSKLQPGEQVHPVAVDSSPPVGTLLCVESLFGWVARAQVNAGAQWLAVMANDSWLKGRIVRDQYADFCVVRAIETRRWIVRASSVGISGFYAPTGERVSTLPQGVPDVQTCPIEPRTQATLFVRWGDWWVYACLTVLVAIGVIRSLARRSGYSRVVASRPQASHATLPPPETGRSMPS
jgi:apolipoprotein N-acyltransferase